MALTPDQLTKLMASVSLKQRAKVVGLPPAAKVEDKRTERYVDSQNTRNLEKAATAAPAAYDKGEIKLVGAPRTLADSGLTAEGFHFDESQLAALDVLTQGRHVCLIGQAGTGKTTMVKHALAQLIFGSDSVKEPYGIRSLSGEQGPSIAICAFTGIATQVVKDTLPGWLHGACKTIHQLLEYKPVDPDGGDEFSKGMFRPTRCATAKLDHDIIVIDEASMLGLDLWHNVVDALRPHTRIILIGDLNQLKPVADATMFAYALSAGIDRKHGWSIAELTTIHRQKEPAANKIIDAATAILQGRFNKTMFDNPQTDPDWRFIGFELPVNASHAHDAIVKAVDYLRAQPTPGTDPLFYISGEPSRPLFDPYNDLLLCAGNGEDENNSASFVQQIPLNGTLSRVIERPSDEHPIHIIDAGRDIKKFAVGHRVMATKNESYMMKDRVTNGMVGRVTKIEWNKNWSGNKALFGSEQEVLAFRTAQAKASLTHAMENFSLASVDTSNMMANQGDKEKQASHVVTVKFKNGAERVYRSSSEVSGIQLAYAMTVHKAQGSQADTVVIIVHQAVKSQLSREWLYTGVTRAKRRVVILYTSMGLATAVNRQQIFGKDLKEKVDRYRMTMNQGRQIVRLEARALTVIRDENGDGMYEVEEGIDEVI